MKKMKKGLVAAVTISIIALGSLIPASSANAINSVPCDSDGFLLFNIDFQYNVCFANSGAKAWGSGMWVSRILTGNNDVNWWADDGKHFLPRWNDLRFPTVRTVRIYSFEII
ncbi:beta/gamma crystallin domain-containing protein [Psychromicrobium sp. YIM B11713]|uniref:beta/gamma crystallin domain-containing protein n=1 Tax=Psychromicrobium sp. YIM B11713 TaxID=3145233 RepID=UPI00374E4947